jgi:hypothetical protein
MTDERDATPVVLVTGIWVTQMQWNNDGTCLAVAGSRDTVAVSRDAVAGSRDAISVAQWYEMCSFPESLIIENKNFRSTCSVCNCNAGSHSKLSHRPVRAKHVKVRHVVAPSGLKTCNLARAGLRPDTPPDHCKSPPDN